MAMKTKPDPAPVAAAAQFGPRTTAGHLDIDALTPRHIKQMLLAAEGGDLAAQTELFERMEEKDGELDALLRTRKAGVARLRYDIEPGDSSPAALRAAELCRELVAAIPDLHQAILDLLDAIPKGLSILEIEWRTDSHAWRPARLLYRPQRWFQPVEEGTPSGLLLRTQDGQGEPLNPLNFIVHRVKARSGFCARTSLLRACVRAFVVRHFAWKDWMAFAELYGTPPRIGWLREEVQWDSEEARELWRAVRALGMDAAAIVREGNRIEVLDTRSVGEGTIFERILDRAGRELTLAVLGQTLTSGGEGGGSYALGRVHNEVRWDLIEADALALGRTLTDQLLRPIVQLNLGGGHPAPSWRFDAQRPENLLELANTVKTLGEAGLAIPADWAYSKFGIPKPAEGQAVLGTTRED